MNSKIILSASNLSKKYTIESGFFNSKSAVLLALDNASISVCEKQIIGVVGESGSGKTTLGKVLCGLIKPDTGNVLIENKNINDFSRIGLSVKIQMIFQDPFASLNPKLTINSILKEALDSSDRIEKINTILTDVGLNSNILSNYPHQFSGGQRQRIAFARALLKNPKIIIADEPLSSLDISIQNQLINLILELKNKTGISFVFISHDLAVTSNISDYLIVMQNGRIVEEGLTQDVINNPKTEYTKRLLDAVPGALK